MQLKSYNLFLRAKIALGQVTGHVRPVASQISSVVRHASVVPIRELEDLAEIPWAMEAMAMELPT